LKGLTEVQKSLRATLARLDEAGPGTVRIAMPLKV